MGGHCRAEAETSRAVGLLPGCPTCQSQKQQESRRSTGDGQGPSIGPLGTAGDVEAVAAHAFLEGRAPEPRRPVLAHMSSPALTGNSDRLKSEPVVSSLSASL